MNLSAQTYVNYDKFLRAKSPSVDALLRLEKLCGKNGWDIILFGGAARDIILDGENAAPRDLDVVVRRRDAEGPTPRELGVALTPIVQMIRNGLGGFKVRLAGGFPIDIWPLESSLPFKTHPVTGRRPKFTDLLLLTMFNLEGIAFQLDADGFTVFDAGFYDCMESRVLELQAETVYVSPALCITRAVVQGMKFNLRWGPKLAAYVRAQLPGLKEDHLTRCQKTYYGHVLRSASEVISLATMASREDRTPLAVERQGGGIVNPRGLMEPPKSDP